MLPDMKTPLIWLLALGLALSLAGLGAQQVQLSELRAALAEGGRASAEQAVRQLEAVAADEKETGDAEKAHAIETKEIEHALSEAKRDLDRARAERADLSGRLLDTAADLQSAHDQLEARADASACSVLESQHRVAFGLLAEAGGLLASAGDLAREGGDIVQERDAEVAALVRLVEADRALMARASGGLRVKEGFWAGRQLQR